MKRYVLALCAALVIALLGVGTVAAAGPLGDATPGTVSTPAVDDQRLPSKENDQREEPRKGDHRGGNDGQEIEQDSDTHQGNGVIAVPVQTLPVNNSQPAVQSGSGDAENGDTEQTNDNSVNVSNEAETEQKAAQAQSGCGGGCDQKENRPKNDVKHETDRCGGGCQDSNHRGGGDGQETDQDADTDQVNVVVAVPVQTGPVNNSTPIVASGTGDAENGDTEQTNNNSVNVSNESETEQKAGQAQSGCGGTCTHSSGGDGQEIDQDADTDQVNVVVAAPIQTGAVNNSTPIVTSGTGDAENGDTEQTNDNSVNVSNESETEQCACQRASVGGQEIDQDADTEQHNFVLAVPVQTAPVNNSSPIVASGTGDAENGDTEQTNDNSVNVSNEAETEQKAGQAGSSCGRCGGSGQEIDQDADTDQKNVVWATPVQTVPVNNSNPTVISGGSLIGAFSSPNSVGSRGLGDAENGDTEQTNDNSVNVSNEAETEQSAAQWQSGCGGRCTPEPKNRCEQSRCTDSTRGKHGGSGQEIDQDADTDQENWVFAAPVQTLPVNNSNPLVTAGDRGVPCSGLCTKHFPSSRGGDAENGDTEQTNNNSVNVSNEAETEQKAGQAGSSCGRCGGSGQEIDQDADTDQKNVVWATPVQTVPVNNSNPTVISGTAVRDFGIVPSGSGGDAENGDTEQTNDNSVNVSNEAETEQSAAQWQSGCGGRCTPEPKNRCEQSRCTDSTRGKHGGSGQEIDQDADTDQENWVFAAPVQTLPVNNSNPYVATSGSNDVPMNSTSGSYRYPRNSSDARNGDTEQTNDNSVNVSNEAETEQSAIQRRSGGCGPCGGGQEIDQDADTDQKNVVWATPVQTAPVNNSAPVVTSGGITMLEAARSSKGVRASSGDAENGDTKQTNDNSVNVSNEAETEQSAAQWQSCDDRCDDKKEKPKKDAKKKKPVKKQPPKRDGKNDHSGHKDGWCGC